MVSPNRKYCTPRDQTRQVLERQHLFYRKARTFHPVCSGAQASIASKGGIFLPWQVRCERRIAENDSTGAHLTRRNKKPGRQKGGIS